MGTAILKIKLMPESLDTDLEEVKKLAEEKIRAKGGKPKPVEEEPIAFGLKALIITFLWPEEQDTEIAENALKEIDGLSSVTIIDYRRDFV